MKNCYLFLLFLSTFSIAQSQIKNGSTSIRSQLEKVVQQFPNDFSSLKGEPLPNEPQTIQYASTVAIPGALDTRIVGYPSKKKIYWIWESKLFAAEEFEKFKKQYKAYYNDIAGRTLMIKTSISKFVPSNAYEEPSEDFRFLTNQFQFEKDQEDYKNLVIDLIAEYANFEWVIYLRVYDKEKDSEIKPSGN